ncbi:SH3 domain-containing protein [Arcicella aurantiaca]|uniref:SH3 domain-containing protein n=1 Tax=Arcicella aurantiaca TaxID=591202 RepID=A0A316EA75_9BACT|nr:SH3 domain-containing protein [Arcicella aurantiaca]PWK27012.1 SH3 domain-containing protein [Arcicella aurantiaca]
MLNLLDYINSLTVADSRSGQNRLVKAKSLVVGYAQVQGGVGGNSSSYKAGEIIGIVQDTATVSVKATNGVIVKVAYTKITLQEPYYTTGNDLVSYLWFPTSQIDFEDEFEKETIPVTTDNKALKAVYSDAPKGIYIRETPSTLANKVKVVAYGDVVGYTDGQEKKYLTYTFWKIYDQKGRAIGWCAKGSGYSTTQRPQAKALPKYDSKGETTEETSGVTAAQDPQAGNSDSSGVSAVTIILWVVGVLGLGYLGVKLLFKNNKNGN